MNGAIEYVPTKRERLGWRLFPRRDQPPRPCPFNGHDMVIVDVRVEISFLDRLRLLLSGRLRLLLSGRLGLRVRVETENVVGKNFGNFEIHIQPPRWLSR